MKLKSSTYTSPNCPLRYGQSRPQTIQFGGHGDSYEPTLKQKYIPVTVGKGKNKKTVFCMPNSPFGNPCEDWSEVAKSVQKQLEAYQNLKDPTHSVDIPESELARDAEDSHSPKNLFLGCGLEAVVQNQQATLMAGPNFRALYIPEEHCMYIVNRYHAEKPGDGVKVFLNKQNDPNRFELKNLYLNNPFFNVHDYFAWQVYCWANHLAK
ncbi:MAG TPA: hypothetical protein V6C52_05235 [Coleofasciculaceae cyanobacterium]|jgi:hypothetical protein